VNYSISALRFFLMATTALVCAELAQAQEPPQPKNHYGSIVPFGKAVDAPKKPIFNWAGFHIGIGGGGVLMRANSSVHSHVSQGAYNPNYGNYFESYAINQSINRSVSKAGGFGTLSLGYDAVVGSTLFGGFADLNLQDVSAHASTVDTTPSSVGGGPDLPATATLSHKIGLGASVDIGARLGLLASERTLVYALAGASFAQIDAKSTIAVQHDASSALSNFSLTTETNVWRPGFTVGAGVEYMLTENVSLQTEYRYADYGKIKSQKAVTLIDGTATNDQADSVSEQTIRAVLSYHF